MKRAGTVACVVLACLAVGMFVQADDKDAKYYQKQFTLWSKVIADLKEADVTEACGQDIEVIRTWISQAQAFLASDKLEEIDPLLRKIKVQADYIRAKVNRLAAEDAASEAEELAKTAEAEAQKVSEAASAADAKMKDLEAKGL